MIVIALDTLHISAVSANSIAPGASFEVSDLEGAELISRGLVAPAVTAKAEAAPLDKAMKRPPPARRAD